MGSSEKSSYGEATTIERRRGDKEGEYILREAPNADVRRVIDPEHAVLRPRLDMLVDVASTSLTSALQISSFLLRIFPVDRPRTGERGKVLETLKIRSSRIPTVGFRSTRETRDPEKV